MLDKYKQNLPSQNEESFGIDDECKQDWFALMIQLEKFVGSGGVVADTNYLYPVRWGRIKNK